MGLPEAAMNAVLEEVAEERARQDGKWGQQNHVPAIWIVILGEEFGELCQASLESDHVAMRTEALQVAAVAVAFVERLDRYAVQALAKP
jgi:NTP pyrophosphatase (non-canonical NTP hydrolase)